jgi:hypothetical protein
MPRHLLIAGLDYGTSFTKIVVRDNNTPGMHAKVVVSEEFQDGLFPSTIGLIGERIFFPPSPANSIEILYLKMLAADISSGDPLQSIVVDRPRSKMGSASDMLHEGEIRHRLMGLISVFNDDLALIRSLLAFYFANVMLKAERFIASQVEWRDFDFSKKDFDDFLIYQLAVPSGLMGSDSASERLFREALILGFLLRDHPVLRQKDGVSALEWRDLTAEAGAGRDLCSEKEFEWQCLVYPETAGAVQAYFRSPNASDGLFITMDVGAGTVDLNAFRRQQKVRDSSYYATIVCPLGLQNISSPLTTQSPQGEVAVMEELRHKIQAINLLARKYQPNHGTRPGTRTWDRATFFIFGGGANHRPYWDHYKEGLKSSGIHDPQILQLPSANDLTRPRGVDFGRFAVAYGLSFFKPSLDRVKLPHELETFDALFPPRHVDERPPYGFNWED